MGRININIFITALVSTLVFVGAAVSTVFAQSEVDIGITQTGKHRIPLSIAPFMAIDGANADDARRMEQLVVADLEFSGLFKITRGTIPAATNGGRHGQVELRGQLVLRGGTTHFEGRAIDVDTGQSIGGKRYIIKDKQVRQVAHHFSDEIVKMLTGEQGVASTRILYRKRTKDSWEVVMSDYDGHNPRVLVRQSVPILSPRWVDEGKAMVYSSFRYGKADLFLRYLAEPESKRIAAFEGLNYSVDWSDDRRLMVATLSKDGNAEIYLLDKNGEIKRRLTHSNGIDVSPSWSPTGREILFTSDRSGSPQIYVMESHGGNVRRLTFVGNYNESPVWSPKGDRIAFVSRIDGFFQLCLIRPDGSEFTLITNEAVNHEDPRWAPNGRHLVYAEKRGGESLISIIDTGTNGKRILAQGENPDWSTR